MASDNKDLAKVISSINRTDGVSVKEMKGKTAIKIFVACEGERSEKREDVQKTLQSVRLRYKNIYVRGHSEEATEITGKNIVLIYKNKKGGMSETTLNATITELFPCIAFLTNITETNPEKFYNKILENDDSNLSCYVNSRDAKSGKEFIDSAIHSSKFAEKITNAIAILDYIKSQDSGKKIKNLYWGYRAKPPGISTNHPGDIFIEYIDGDMLGISLKAGGAKTKEPKLNTYVNPIIEYFGKQNDYKKWQKESYEQYYMSVPNIPSFSDYGTAKMIPALADLERSNASLYNSLYDEQLEWTRDKIIDMMNTEHEKTKKYLLEKVAGVQENVPLIVLKAFGNQTQILKDDDVVKECVQRSKKGKQGINVYKSTTSKQNFNIDLICNSHKTTLNFSIRTKKPGNEHKLGHFLNLAVLFLGVE